jgi:pimeloyl-ACP methyl ester carboxylesterase
MSLASLPCGATIWYRREGSGPPLLHIHGSAFGHANFGRLTPLMLPDFEVIDFDLPGYGESRGTPPEPGFPGLATIVGQLIRELGYPRVHVHGTSFGAMIALTLAAQEPGLVDRLVLSCFLARYDGAARMMRATWKRAARDSGMAAVADLTSVAGFARGFYEQPGAAAQLQSMREAFARNTPEAFIAGTETIERADLSPLVPMVRAPTLLLAGAEDNMTPFSPAASGIGFAQIRGMLPGAELEVLPDCGHYLVIEQPGRAATRIRGFLAG